MAIGNKADAYMTGDTGTSFMHGFELVKSGIEEGEDIRMETGDWTLEIMRQDFIIIYA